MGYSMVTLEEAYKCIDLWDEKARTPQLEPISEDEVYKYVKDSVLETWQKDPTDEGMSKFISKAISQRFGQPKVSEEEIEGIMESVYIELCLEKEDIFMTKPQVKRVAKAITNKLNRGE